MAVTGAIGVPSYATFIVISAFGSCFKSVVISTCIGDICRRIHPARVRRQGSTKAYKQHSQRGHECNSRSNLLHRFLLRQHPATPQR